MKKLFFSFTTLLILFAFVFYPNKESLSNATGSPGGKTNSPGDGQNCTACHSTFALNSGSGVTSIATNIPISGYIPGSTYIITTTITQTSIIKFGFELTAEDANNVKKDHIRHNQSL